MIKNRVIYLLIFTSLLISCVEKKPPNIILILADDQGWGSTSVAFDPEIRNSSSDFIATPNLERLASRSVIFSKGYAPHPNCSPSRASILTGKSPAQLHLTDIVERHTGELYEGNRLIPPAHVSELDSEEITIAELLKKERPEYRSAHFGKWHLAGGGPEAHGFDASHGPTSNREGDRNPDDDPKKIFTIVNDGIAWMQEQLEDGNPFYLQLSHYATHLGYESKPETRRQLGNKEPGDRHDFIPFAAMAQDLDEGVGLLLDKLDQLGIRDNTYIIYLADNGTYPTNNTGNINGPLHGWKATLWEGGIRVPFMISGPGIDQGYYKQLVTGVDILPTICEWLEIDNVPSGVEGGSLVPVLENPSKEVKRKHDYWVFHFPHYQLQKGNHPVSSIYWNEYKLLKWYETGKTQLYNLDNDLLEVNDVSEENSEIVLKMSNDLDVYLKEIKAGLPEVNPEYDELTDPGLPHQKTKEKLMNEPYFIIK